MGKEARRPDLGIVALQNKNGEIVTGRNRDGVVQDYMVSMWGTPPVDAVLTFDTKVINRKAPKEMCDSMLNAHGKRSRRVHKGT
jgi:hypothetical protein